MSTSASTPPVRHRSVLGLAPRRHIAHASLRGALLGLGSVLLSSTAWATTYYVDTNNPQASDSNPGTSPAAPWKTIQQAASTLVAGDTVNIVAGTYDEDVTMQSPGTAAARITYQAYQGGAVVIPRDFTVGQDYVVVSGLEISGASLWIDGSHCQIIGNYVHHAGSCGVFIHGTYNLIRGNRIANNGADWGDQVTTGWGNGDDVHHYVFEYNDVSDAEGRGEDFMQYMSHDAIIRGNHFHDLGDNGRHNDCYQSGGGEHDIWILGNTFENLGGVQYYMPGDGDADHVWRKNVFWGAIGWGLNGAATGMYVLSNTFGTAEGGYGYGGGGLSRNNIYNDWGTEGPYWADDADYNLINPVATYGATEQPHDLWGIDPLFVDFAGHDFHLQASSPCIDAGTFVTHTTSAGTGTTLPVENARLFVDGFGIADGDSLQLEGQTQIVMVTSVDYATNVVTVDQSLTWTAGLGVAVPYTGAAPDIGAYEYGLGCTSAGECATPPLCHTADGATCTNGSCLYPALPSATSCDDADACTEGEQCDDSGHCVAGSWVCGDAGPGGAGGSGAAGGGASSAGGNPADRAEADSGCGCRITGRDSSSHDAGFGTAGLALLGAAVRRARARGRRRR